MDYMDLAVCCPRKADKLNHSLTPTKPFKLRFNFHWNLFLWVQLTNWHNGLVPNRRQAIIWTNDGLVCWRIYASLRLYELTKRCKRRFQIHFLEGNLLYFDLNSIVFLFSSDNLWAVCHVMAWYWICDKPLPAMMTQMNDFMPRHKATTTWWRQMALASFSVQIYHIAYT